MSHLPIGLVAAALLSVSAVHAAPKKPTLSPGDRWWADVSAIASDANEGRLTGSPGYFRAAAYVEDRLKAIGLKPGGENGGFRQTVTLEQQAIDNANSSAALNGQPFAVGQDLLISGRGAPAPASVDAPLVFLGYGLHIPGRGYDDFAGLDLKGKVAVVIAGGPADLPGPDKSNARSRRARYLAAAGAVGVITLTTVKQTEIPWDRTVLNSTQPAMYLTDTSLRESPDNFFTGNMNLAVAERLFAGSGHTYAEVAALADASAPVPRFALPGRFTAKVATKKDKVISANIVARLDGADAKLKREYVVVSAHLDHLGIGQPIDGDPLFNGAMDNASGVANVLDIAARLKTGPRLKRSVLFVFVTAEEKGELGSHVFAERPTVRKAGVVADLNFDMPLPLWPLKSVIVLGADESTLGAAAQQVSKRMRLPIAPDPLPDRNSFTRSDQYSWVKAGVPALAFKFGFAKDTPEFEIEKQWRATRYHAPSDDLAQPNIHKEDAARLNAYVAAIAAAVANGKKRPEWSPFSGFNPANSKPL